MTRIAINGFGRIGRTFLRVLLQEPEKMEGIDVVAINIGGLEPAAVAHMFIYDTTMGTLRDEVAVADGYLLVKGHRIRILASNDPAQLPWRDLAIDWVVDCTGKFTQPGAADKHLKAGAKKVLISAPAAGAECTIIPGVNDDTYKPSCKIVSLGSCTTNALLPLLKIVDEQSGLESATVVTIHAYTNTQGLLDGGVHSIEDMRRHRAAPLNMVPSTTGAASLVGTILPHLAGKVSAMAVRVPVANVSFLEVSWIGERAFTRDQIDGWFDAAAKGALHSIVSVTHEQLVSSDFLGNSSSVVYDATLTLAEGRLGTIFGWYDNEWGYCARMRDFIVSVQ